jgi:hypothetical protein
MTKRYSSLHTTIGAARVTPGVPTTRRTVACSSESCPTRLSNCLGYFSRDKGHSRVPEPPDKTTDWTKMLFCIYFTH